MCERLNEFSSEDFGNVDTPIVYSQKFDEYGLKIMDGGNSSLLVAFCPWCGERLPESRREEWFDAIEKLGINPWTEEIPKRYQTDEWYKDKW
jgi:hypothetical protein